METKLDKLKMVYQTTNIIEVNEYLAKGYKIIKIFSTRKVVGNEDIIEPCYILGLEKI